MSAKRSRHYGLYLYPDDPEDAALIAYLQRYVDTSRVGDTLRRALMAYTRLPSTVEPARPAQLPLSTPVDSPAIVPAAASATKTDLVSKAKKAFFK